MDFKQMFPGFESIEEHVRRAHVERSVYLAHVIAGFITAAGHGLRRVTDAMGSGLAAERDRRAVEADAFLKRSVPKY